MTLLSDYKNPDQIQLALKRAQALETHKGLTPSERRQVSKVKKSLIKRLHSIRKLKKLNN